MRLRNRAGTPPFEQVVSAREFGKRRGLIDALASGSEGTVNVAHVLLNPLPQAQYERSEQSPDRPEPSRDVVDVLE